MKAVVDIYSGFLGAGKTMLIRKLLSEHVYENNTVIIENEFGEVGIDGDVLRESNIEVKEINSGCICCQVSGKFSDAVLEVIRKYNPKNIIIEPSGVAKLSEILKVLDSIKFQHLLEIRNIYTVIDILNYDRYILNFKDFYVNQIEQADKLVISKSQYEDSDKINEVISSLRKYNENAEIIYKPWDKLKGNDFTRKNITSRKAVKDLLNQSRKLPGKGYGKLLKKTSNNHADDVFETIKVDIDRDISINEIEHKFEMISGNKTYGNIIRAKGFIRAINGEFYVFDYVPHEFKSRKIKWANKKVVSIIGRALNEKELYKLFL